MCVSLCVCVCVCVCVSVDRAEVGVYGGWEVGTNGILMIK